MKKQLSESEFSEEAADAAGSEKAAASATASRKAEVKARAQEIEANAGALEAEADAGALEAEAKAGAREAEADAGAPSNDAERQRDQYYDLLLRKTAEFDNFRKRTERERQTLSEAAAADLLSELLPLVDDLERALEADPGDAAANAYRRGVELIHRQLLEVLRKRGVRPIEARGADFDPHYHQAVSHEPVEGKREGEVIEEFRRGYMLGDRLLRPAMVKVAKGRA